MVCFILLFFFLLPFAMASSSCTYENIGPPFVSFFPDLIDPIETGCMLRSNITVILVHHGSIKDAFWYVVEDGAYRAASNTGVSLSIRTTEYYDLQGMAELVMEAINERPDYLIVSLPDATDCDKTCAYPYADCSGVPCYISTLIKEAVAREIRVITINSGSNIFEQAGATQHVGQVEFVAGEGGCSKLIDETDAKHILMTDPESGTNGGINERITGCKKACIEKNVNYTVSKMDKSSSTLAAANIQDTIYDGDHILQTSAPGEHSFIDAIFSLNPQGCPGLPLGSPPCATFDFSPTIGEGIQDGRILFAIDQQQYLQGYLPVIYASLDISTGNSLPKTYDEVGAQDAVSTGPGFITSDRLEQKACESVAVTYCDDSVESPYGGRYPLGFNPTCPCVPRQDIRICFVHHGGPSDAFWWVVETAAAHAAADENVQVEIRTPSWGRDDIEMLRLVEECLENDPDGLILSIPDETFKPIISDTEVPVISINTGSDLFTEFGAIMHIGQDEYVAGQTVARELHKVIGLDKLPNFLCIDHQSGTHSGLSFRCKGLLDYLKQVGGSSPEGGGTWSVGGLFKDFQIGVDNSNVASSTMIVQDAIEKANNEYNISINGLVALGAPSCQAAVNLKWMETFQIGCFDTQAAQTRGIRDTHVEFAVDQQQYLQGYLSIVYIVQKILTGNIVKSSDKISHTGPGILREEKLAFKECESQEDAAGTYRGWIMCPSLSDEIALQAVPEKQRVPWDLIIPFLAVVTLAGVGVAAVLQRRNMAQKHEIEVLANKLSMLQQYNENEKKMIKEQIVTFRRNIKDAKASAGTTDTSEVDDALRKLLINAKDLVTEEQIGKGSFGEVFKASYRGSTVAVKTMKTVEMSSLDRFREEILIMADLHHSNIVLMIGACWEQDLMALVMEYCTKGTANDVLKRNGEDFTWDDPLFKWVLDACRALGYLHSVAYFDTKSQKSVNGIVHRDMKPDNCLVTETFSLKIGDFGESKAILDDETMTQVGTPLFVAPEVVTGEQYDSKCDIYSFAMTILSFALKGKQTLTSFLHMAWVASIGAEGSDQRVKASALSVNAGRISHKMINKQWRPSVKHVIEELKMPPTIASLLLLCWDEHPENRPTALEILEYLENNAAKSNIEGFATDSRTGRPSIRRTSTSSTLMMRIAAREKELEEKNARNNSVGRKTIHMEMDLFAAEHGLQLKELREQNENLLKRNEELERRCLRFQESQRTHLPGTTDS